MADRHIPCLVLTRNYTFPSAMLEVAQERHLPIFRTPMITMNFVNTATLCVDNEFAPSTTEQGTTVDIKGVGVMIRGDSGVGKSECALALVERGHSLVADDITVIKVLDERELMASSRPITRGYMECRGIGIINIAEMFGIKSVRLEKRIDMVVSLREWTPDAVEERTGLEENLLRDPRDQGAAHRAVRAARAATSPAWSRWPPWSRRSKRMGHDPAKDFNDRLIAHMAETPRMPEVIQGDRTRLPREEPPHVPAV